MKNKIYPEQSRRKIFFKLFLLLAVLGLGFFAFSSEAQAATYYVSSTGSGTICSDTSPCVLNYGVNIKASSGDTVIAKAGKYNQSMNVTKSNITIQGELDSNGNRLSIIDPYVNVSGGWTETAAGSGVYKKTVGHKTWGATVSYNDTRYKIQRLCQSGEYPSGGCANPLYYLQLPDEPGTRVYSPTHSVNVWDGFDVMFTSNDTDTWMRFRNKLNSVNSNTIHLATSGESTINIYGVNNVTIKDFEIHAKKYGIYSEFTNLSYITITNNKILFGQKKIRLNGCSNCTISNNYITDQSVNDDYNGTYIHGAWKDTPVTYSDKVLKHLYLFAKYHATNDDGGGTSQAIYMNGSYNQIYGNTIKNMVAGINMWFSDNFNVYSNDIRNTSSTCLDAESGSSTNSMLNSAIHDNYFANCNSNLRFQNWNGSNNTALPKDNNADLKVYRNKFWLPENHGQHIYFHYLVNPSTAAKEITKEGTIWAYHNSFSGGETVFHVSGEVEHYSSGGMGKVYLVNNIMSSHKDYYVEKGTAPLGLCSYNWQAGLNQCSGTSNYDNGTTLMWDAPVTPPDFAIPLPNGIDAVEGGIDISEEFTIGATTYPALPGFTAGYGGTDDRPNMGAVQSGDDNLIDTTPPAPPSGVSVQ